MKKYQCKRCGDTVKVLGPGHRATCSCRAAVVTIHGMYVPERNTFYPNTLIAMATRKVAPA